MTIYLLYISNVLATTLEDLISEKVFLEKFELFSIIAFSIEYILRIWTADIKYKNISPLKARLKYIFSIMGFIDLIIILPFFIFTKSNTLFDARILRIFRLIRSFRLLKLFNFLESFRIIGNVFKKRRNDLLVTFFMVFLILIIAASFIYALEKEVQPDKFSDIPSALWWAVATLTTIGYGDVYPITYAGKLFAAFISILGIGMVALPTGIISSGFIDEIKENEKIASDKKLRLNSSTQDELQMEEDEKTKEEDLCILKEESHAKSLALNQAQHKKIHVSQTETKFILKYCPGCGLKLDGLDIKHHET